MKGPVEITLKKVALPLRGWRTPYDDWVEDGDVAVFRIGGGLAVVGTTFSESNAVTKSWIRGVASLSRGRHLRAPLVVGLVALRGRAPGLSYREVGRARNHPRHRDNPIRCIALCVGGSHALMYHPDCCNHKYTRGPLAFYHDKMSRLRAFLGDARVTVACVGAKEAAGKLAKEWGLHVARPAELTDLFARAYGKVAGVEAERKAKKPEKYWMSKAALAREKAKAEAEDDDDKEEEYSEQGRRTAKVVKGLGLERMARVALGPEMRLARWPMKVTDADWGGYSQLGDEEWMCATRDAYLCFEIALRCLQKLGAPVGA